MSFAHPLALLLLVPAGVLVASLGLWQGRVTMSLPGHWHRIIDPAMRSFMAGRVVARSRLPVALWLAIWALLVLALARPVVEIAEPTAYGNLAGRVIAMDMGAGVDVERQRLIAFRILDSAPATPTALVVATSEAFDIVPFTTDRDHLDRYLQAVGPNVMPVSGRAPGMAITHAESLLERAGMAVGQLVLITGGDVPEADATLPDKWLRALVVDRDHLEDWDDYADRIGARLIDETAIYQVIRDLDGEAADTFLDSEEAAEFSAGPWLILVAAGLWLLFFRRIRSS